MYVLIRGQKPNEVEEMYLENAQMLALYGVHMHPAKVSAVIDTLFH